MAEFSDSRNSLADGNVRIEAIPLGGARFLAEDSASVGLAETIETIASRSKTVVAIFLVAVTLGTLYALLAPPVYVSDSLIQIEEKKGTTLGGIQEIAAALEVGQSPTAGEIDVVKSREVIGSAIKALHADIIVEPRFRVPYFADRFERSIGGKGIELAQPFMGLTHVASGGETISVSQFEVPNYLLDKNFVLSPLSSTTWQLLRAGSVLAIGAIGQTVNFPLGQKSGSIRVDSIFSRPGIEFNVKRLSATDGYKRILDDLRVTETSRQSSVIRLTVDAADPNTASSLVNEISKAYLTQNYSRRSEEAERSLQFLDQQLPQLKTAVEKSEEAFNAYRLSKQTVNLDKESEALLARSVDIAKQRVDTEMKKQLLEQRFQQGNPEVTAINGALSSLQNDDQQLTKEIQKLPAVQQEYFRLERDVKVNTDLYIALLNNAQQLKIAKAGTIGNVRVIDFGEPDYSPSRPKRALCILGAGIFGLVFGIGFAFFARALKRTIRSGDEIERVIGLPTFVSIPASARQRGILRRGGSQQRKLLHTIDPHDPAIEALRSMRLGLQFAMVGSRNRTVVITGPTPSIGKTFVSANLGAVLADSGKKVVVLDSDMRRPQLSNYAGLRRGPGLSDYLSGANSIGEILQQTSLSGFTVISAGTIPPNPSELLLRVEFGDLIQKLNQEFDYVIVDTPPLLPVGDALTVCRLADAVFMVVRAEETTVQQLTESIRKLATAGISPKGAILNGVPVRRFGYQYGYTYGVSYAPKP